MVVAGAIYPHKTNNVRVQPLQDMSHKRSYPNTHHAYPACMGCAWSWMPSAAVTFRIVAKLGLPSPDNAL